MTSTEHADVVRRPGPIAVVAAALLAATVMAPSAAAAEDDPVAAVLARPDRLDSLHEIEALAAATEGDDGVPVGVVIDRNGDDPGGVDVERITTAAARTGQLTEVVESVEGVVTAAVDRPVSIGAVPSDPLVPQQYGPPRIGAWSVPSTSDGRGTTVAVVDTGVKGDHADLGGTLPDGRPHVAAGNSFLWGDPASGTPGNVDPHGHGTHVAGIIGATRNNGRGVAGVAPGAQILPVRVLNAGGTGWSSDVAAGILWAHQQGADVINLSLGAPGAVPGDVAAVITFVSTDLSRGKPASVVVVAAGNAGPTSPAMWPAAHERAIAVAATDATDAVAAFSSWGSYVDVAAPGSGILSTCRTGGYCTMSGTSMAAPMVSGAVAVLRGRTPSLTPEAARARLEATATDLRTPGRDKASGAGRIDLVRASSSTRSTSPVSSRPSGTLDAVLTDRRRLTAVGTAFDPQGVPAVKVVTTNGATWRVQETHPVGGRWAAVVDAEPGLNTLCAAGLDAPTGETVLLGCRDVVVK